MKISVYEKNETSQSFKLSTFSLPPPLPPPPPTRRRTTTRRTTRTTTV